MLFFLNDAILPNKSGIEFAQIQRLNLFKKNNQSAMIVTRRYNNLLHRIISDSGIDDQHFVNMFDFFQDACLVPTKKITISDLAINQSWNRKTNGNDYVYENNGRQILYVRRNNDNEKTDRKSVV